MNFTSLEPARRMSPEQSRARVLARPLPDEAGSEMAPAAAGASGLLPEPVREGLLATCLLAAFADGAKSEDERSEFRRIAAQLAGHRAAATVDVMSLYQEVLLGQFTVDHVAQALPVREHRALAYELAVGVCDADDVVNDRERAFLAELRRALALDPEATEIVDWRAAALAEAAVPPPLPTAQAPAGGVRASAETGPSSALPAGESAVHSMILGYAVLNGALELLPESLATMATVPLQMKMVYRIAQRHGHTLDRRQIGELLAAAGVGLTSQVVEGYARKLLGGLLGRFGGGTGRAVGNQVAGSALTFATTYALGRLALAYYAGGRTLSGPQLRGHFQTLLGEAKQLHARHAQSIQERARTLNPAQLVSLVRGH